MNKRDLILKASKDFPQAAKQHADETTIRILRETREKFLEHLNATLLAGLADVSGKLDQEVARLENGFPAGKKPEQPQTAFASETGNMHSYQDFDYIYIKSGAAAMRHDMQDVSVSYEEMRALPGFKAVLQYGQELGVAAEVGLTLQVYTGMDEDMRSEYDYPTKDFRGYFDKDTEGHVVGLKVMVDLERPFDPAHYPLLLHASPEQLHAAQAEEARAAMTLQTPVKVGKALQLKK